MKMICIIKVALHKSLRMFAICILVSYYFARRKILLPHLWPVLTEKFRISQGKLLIKIYFLFLRKEIQVKHGIVMCHSA